MQSPGMDIRKLDPLSIRPQLKDMLVGMGAMVAVYALLIGSAFGLSGLDLLSLIHI